MSEPRKIDPRVREAIARWGRAADVDAAAHSLAESHRELDETLHEELATEAAEVTAEMLFDLLKGQAAPKTEGEARVVAFGVELTAHQAERLAAWLEDQEQTRRALALPPEAWAKALATAIETMGLDLSERSIAGDDRAHEVARAVREALGDRATQFENRPEPGKSDAAGVRGQISARTFSTKKRK